MTIRGIALAAALTAYWCMAMGSAPAEAKVRTIFIAADQVVWNYAPSGRDDISGGALARFTPLQLGWSYRKILYREYTDATFRTLKQRPAWQAYLGLLGPVIHAEVGDTIDVTFKNNSPIPVGIQPKGLMALAPTAVAPKHVEEVRWTVTDRAGPGPNDPSSIAWPYVSMVDENRDENTGMIGAIVVSRRGAAKADGSPAGVDREVFSLFTEMDETRSRLIDKNLADPRLNPRHIKPAPPGSGFIGGNQFFSIDGYVYGNMPLPAMRVGEHVRWYVLTTRSDFDAHTPHWHGQNVLVGGMRTDTLAIAVNRPRIVDMVPDNPGIWLFHCHVAGHLAAGMEARYQVLR